MAAPRHPEPRNSAAAERRAARWAELDIAAVGARVGKLIRQGSPLPVVLATLCQLFDSNAEGFCSSVLLLDRTGTKARNAAGYDLPASYMKQLAAPAAAPGYRLYQVSSILSLTGEPLGIFAVYRRERSPMIPRSPSALIPPFIHVASAAIERVRSDNALERSAAFLGNIQQLTSTCCFSWRVESNEISWSKELCQLFELDPAEAPVTLERIGARIHSDDLPSFQEMIERARSGVSGFEFEHRLSLPDNSVKYLHVVAHRTCEQDGHLEYIGAAQDVTHRRHTEEALANLRADLAGSAKVANLGVLTAAIAHEINQPLAGIVTNASTCRRMLAADPPDVEGARETARRTIRDAERASEIVKQLRALFCKKDTVSEPVDLNEATREVVTLSLSELVRNKVTVSTELNAELPQFQGDRVQMQQVILNLLLNASDAMSGVDNRPRQLVIRTERENENRLRLSVRDTGTGFDPHQANRLFDAFYTTKSGGMGIGLSISRSIIESHQGRLWATPNDGPGATFSFSVPSDPTM